MEEFEVKTINSAPTPLSMAHVCRQHFHYPTGGTQPPTPPTHLQDPHIQFTTGDPNQDGTLPFLVTLDFPRSRQHLKEQFIGN